MYYSWVVGVEDKIKNNEKVDIWKDLPLKKDLWLKNFVKSAISTSLIALAFNFIFNGFITHNESQILIGTVAFLLAIIIIFIIDSYHQKVREMELKALTNNSNMNLSRKEFDDEIDKVLNMKLKEMIKEDD